MAFLSAGFARWRARRRRRRDAGLFELEERIGSADRIDDALFEESAEPPDDGAGAAGLRRGAGLLVATVAVATIAIPAFDGGGGGPAPGSQPTLPAGMERRVPAPVGCGAACRPSLVRSAIRGPLRLPGLDAGRCPVTEVRQFPPGAGFRRYFVAAVSGALRLATLTRPDGTVSLAGSSRIGRWHVRRLVWVFDPSYGGPALLRGARIDAPGDLRFGQHVDAAGYDAPPGRGWPHRSLLYVRGGLGGPAATGATSYPSSIAVEGPGCYGIQVDGEGVSDTLVFRIVRR